MLDAADILVDRHPVVVLLAIERRRLEPRRGEAIEVPARIDEGVERVGLALRRPAAGRAGDVLPGRMALERIARLVDLDVVGQLDRQVLLRHRHDAALRAVDRRDRRSPNSAGATPASRAGGTGWCPCRRPSARAARSPSPWRPRRSRPLRKSELIMTPSSTNGRLGDAETLAASASLGHHHRDDRQAVLGRELVVALVVAGAAEDRAGAVFHQHEVGGIDRHASCPASADAWRAAAACSPASRRSRSRPRPCRSCGTPRRSAAGRDRCSASSATIG